MTKSRTSTQTRSSDERVLAIDPGFDRIGAAILARDPSASARAGSNTERLLFSMCIETDRKATQGERLADIGTKIRSLIHEWKPEYLAIEKLFFNQNTTSAIRVAEARGVIIYEATIAELEIFEYGPQEIKIAVTGYGKAGKAEVQSMALRLLGISKKPKRDDEADAIAVGLTHLASYKHKKRLSTE
jgi:crossover junction endodeoxyribonuclease RuvC